MNIEHAHPRRTSDPREFRMGRSGIAHIRRTTPTKGGGWSRTNGILFRHGVPSYCGTSVMTLPVVTEPERVCQHCNVAAAAE